MNSHGAVDFFLGNAQDKHEANDRQQRKEKCPEKDSYGPKIEAADLRAVQSREAEWYDEKGHRCEQGDWATPGGTNSLQAPNELRKRPDRGEGEGCKHQKKTGRGVGNWRERH